VRAAEPSCPPNDGPSGAMLGEIVYTEVPAGDTASGRELWDSLLMRRSEAFSSPSEHRIGRRTTRLLSRR
jgi:hypothetical protein